MSYRARVLIALAALALAAAWLGYRLWPPAAVPAASAALYAARFPDGRGTPQALGQWRGKTLVVNFWASWCPPCLEEMPELSRLQDKYRAQGLQLVGLSTDDIAKVRAFAARTPVSYPLLAADYEGMQLAEVLGNTQGALPYTVVVDRAGTIVSTHYGRLDIHALENALRPLLAAAR